jgi:hypothetical protein
MEVSGQIDAPADLTPVPNEQELGWSMWYTFQTFRADFVKIIIIIITVQL